LGSSYIKRLERDRAIIKLNSKNAQCGCYLRLRRHREESIGKKREKREVHWVSLLYEYGGEGRHFGGFGRGSALGSEKGKEYFAILGRGGEQEGRKGESRPLLHSAQGQQERQKERTLSTS